MAVFDVSELYARWFLRPTFPTDGTIVQHENPLVVAASGAKCKLTLTPTDLQRNSLNWETTQICSRMAH